MVITDEQINRMMEEYAKAGKFKDFLDKACATSGLPQREECRKIIVWEYYKSVTEGCNKER